MPEVVFGFDSAIQTRPFMTINGPKATICSYFMNDKAMISSAKNILLSTGWKHPVDKKVEKEIMPRVSLPGIFVLDSGRQQWSGSMPSVLQVTRF